MSYRYDVSYPFLDVAQKYDVSYAHVLAFDDFLANYAGRAPWRPQHKAASAALPEDAKQELYALAKLPVHARGGRTDVCDYCHSEARWNDPLVCIGSGRLDCAVTQRSHL